MGTSGSVYAIYGKDKNGLHVKLRDVHMGEEPKIQKKYASPRVIYTTPKKTAKSKPKKKSKRR